MSAGGLTTICTKEFAEKAQYFKLLGLRREEVDGSKEGKEKVIIAFKALNKKLENATPPEQQAANNARKGLTIEARRVDYINALIIYGLSDGL